MKTPTLTLDFPAFQIGSFPMTRANFQSTQFRDPYSAHMLCISSLNLPINDRYPQHPETQQFQDRTQTASASTFYQLLCFPHIRIHDRSRHQRITRHHPIRRRKLAQWLHNILSWQERGEGVHLRHRQWGHNGGNRGSCIGGRNQTVYTTTGTHHVHVHHDLGPNHRIGLHYLLGSNDRKSGLRGSRSSRFCGICYCIHPATLS